MKGWLRMQAEPGAVARSPVSVHALHGGLRFVIYAAVGLFIALAFFLSPLPEPDDWANLYNGVNRFLHGQALYTQAFVYPPHVAVLLVPLAVLPMRAGYAILSALTLCVLTALAFRRQLGS